MVRGAFNQAGGAIWDMDPDGSFVLLQGTPPMGTTHPNVITNLPRFVAEKLRGAKPQ